MNKEDYQKVKKFYDEVITQGILAPLQINEIWCIVTNKKVEEAQQVPYRLKQRDIAVFVQNLTNEMINELEDLFNHADDVAKNIDSVETNVPKDTKTIGTMENKDEQSHQEDDLYTDVDMQIASLETQYNNAEDANEKRSIKMKLNKLRKTK